MVDWQDPEVIAKETLAFVKLHHVLIGIYLWEFVTNLPYDWKIFTSRRESRLLSPPQMVYLICRYSTLAQIVTVTTFLNITTEINCTAISVFVWIFGDLSVQTAATLIGMRVIAIWNRNRIISGLVMGGLLVQFGLFVYGITQVRADWNAAQTFCVPQPRSRAVPATTAFVLVDICFFVALLWGLGKRREARGFMLWNTLWNQGLIWFAVTTTIGVPAVVMVWLNRNVIWDIMLFTPTSLLQAITATRMCRSLADAFNEDYKGSNDAHMLQFRKGERYPSRVEVSIHHVQTVQQDGSADFGDILADKDVGSPERGVHDDIAKVAPFAV